MLVLDLIKFSIASCIKLSEIESKDDVASSRINILGFFNNALAIDNRCFSPPDNFNPLFPTNESNLSGKLLMKSYILAFLHASINSDSLASSFAYNKFSFIVPLNIYES